MRDCCSLDGTAHRVVIHGGRHDGLELLSPTAPEILSMPAQRERSVVPIAEIKPVADFVVVCHYRNARRRARGAHIYVPA